MWPDLAAAAPAATPAEPVVKCLLVDDREENLMVLQALLRRDDRELLLAQSGTAALELLLEHEVALALLDVQMPEMDGFALAELMRGSERTAHVPIIFVTAGARDRHRLFKGYELGAVDFLYKPIEPVVLQNKVDVFFELYRQRRQLAQDLAERNETLRLNEMFTGVLGHDLRNPLQTIVALARLLEQPASAPRVPELAGRIVASADRMSKLIDNLLDLVRARATGALPLNRAPADLAAVVERVVQEHKAVHPDRVIEVRRIGGATSGEWDTTRLAQIVSNLIGNALQHGAAQGPVQVELDGSHDDAVRVSVINQGIIPPDVLPHLFEPFRESHRRPRTNGLGLGLYIVKQLAAAHQGTIEVESGPGDCTVVHVSIPRRAPAMLAGG